MVRYNIAHKETRHHEPEPAGTKDNGNKTTKTWDIKIIRDSIVMMKEIKSSVKNLTWNYSVKSDLK